MKTLFDLNLKYLSYDYEYIHLKLPTIRFLWTLMIGRRRKNMKDGKIFWIFIWTFRREKKILRILLLKYLNSSLVLYWFCCDSKWRKKKGWGEGFIWSECWMKNIELRRWGRREGLMYMGWLWVWWLWCLSIFHRDQSSPSELLWVCLIL